MALRPAPYDPEQNKYPKIVYPGEPKAGTGTVVNSKEEHDALLAKQKPAEPEKIEKPEIEDDKDALLKTAKDLGIEADGRWGVQKIKDAIAEKQKASA